MSSKYDIAQADKAIDILAMIAASLTLSLQFWRWLSDRSDQLSSGQS